MTRWETSYFEIAPPGLTIAYKNVDILFLKMVSLFSNFM